VIIAVGAISCAGISFGIGYISWHRKRLKVSTQDGSSSVQQTPVPRTDSARSKGISTRGSERDAAQDSHHSRSHGKDAWGEHFKRPPGLDVHLGGAEENRRDNEDDSTDDSEHGSAGGAHKADTPREAARTKEWKRSQTTKTSTNAQEETPPRRSRTSPKTDARGESHEKPMKAHMEAAFGQGLGAGKAGDRQSKSKRKRGSSSSGSAHPKGTAVPPRPHDAAPDDGVPSSAPKAAGQQAPQSSSGSASGPPPPQSASGDEGVPPPASPKANTTEAMADEGAATNVNEHVQKLDVELDATRTKDLEFRRKIFKTLLLKWHPDKNTGGMGCNVHCTESIGKFWSASKEH